MHAGTVFLLTEIVSMPPHLPRLPRLGFHNSTRCSILDTKPMSQHFHLQQSNEHGIRTAITSTHESGLLRQVASR